MALMLLALARPTAGFAQAASVPTPGGAPVLMTASAHPMQYYVSLPQGWAPHGSWPVLVTVTGGLKNFRENAKLFAAARGGRPYIIVTPINLTNGGQGQLRQLPEYHYSSDVWDQVERTGWCRFDLEGLDAVMTDVRRLYGGADRFYIAGHSAGGHLVWLTVFLRPEALAGAVTTGGNFHQRCTEDSVLAAAPPGTAVPIRGLVGEQDDQRAGLSGQFRSAAALARARGFTNLSFRVVAHQDHNPMPAVVLAYFDSLRGGH
jgi:dienelactone hydrolase